MLSGCADAGGAGPFYYAFAQQISAGGEDERGMERAWVDKVAVSAATYFFDKPYDYIVPAALLPMAQVGVRVMVPFGGGNKMTEALILSLAEEEKRPKLKTVASVLDAGPVLDQADLRLAYWMRERYFCTIYDAVKTILPAGLWYRYIFQERLKNCSCTGIFRVEDNLNRLHLNRYLEKARAQGGGSPESMARIDGLCQEILACHDQLCQQKPRKQQNI